jgi:hypothetical protein
MSDTGTRTWTGGAYWNFEARHHRLYGDRLWLTKYATYPYVRLRLHEKGGALLHRRRSEPEIAFAWPEVEGMERVRVLALPFLGEGVRVTLKEDMVWGIPRRFLFFSGRKKRTMDILDIAESKGVRVERSAKNRFVVP